MRRTEIEGRRAKVAELMMLHHTVSSIAEASGIPRATVGRDMAAVRQEWAKARVEAVANQVAEDTRRIAIAEEALWPRVVKGEDKAIASWRSLLELRARLLGLYAPVALRIFVTDAVKRIAEEFPELDEAELVQEAESILLEASRTR